MRLKLFREFVEVSDNLVDAKMSELKDLIESSSTGHNVVYEWKNSDNHQLIINFIYDEIAICYEFDIDNMSLIKVVDDIVEFAEEVNSIEEGLEIIEKDVYNILGVNESKKRGRPKAGRTKSGRKVPGKYLTKNRKLMKKEIEEFQGKDVYKKDWDADYKSGKGGKGKRHETKKSAATKAYQRMYGDK
jgi:hypothetical protein